MFKQIKRLLTMWEIELAERAKERLALATEDRPPAPDEIAVAFAAALLGTGRYENADAAIGAAWSAVPHYYMWRETYSEKIAPMFFKPVADQFEEIRAAMASAPPLGYESVDIGGMLRAQERDREFEARQNFPTSG